jgi:hypothetical protein
MTTSASDEVEARRKQAMLNRLRLCNTGSWTWGVDPVEVFPSKSAAEDKYPQTKAWKKEVGGFEDVLARFWWGKVPGRNLIVVGMR